ncbi:MAG: glucosaminidase domain-containing protein [Bacteroidales bacterium]
MHQFLQGIFKKLLICALALPSGVFAQQKESFPEYIDKYKYIAMAEMRQSGIPASIKLAQAILESGLGKSQLALEANNHFGIKCHDWTGGTYYYDDDEVDECFRVYHNPLHSFLDHTEFLTNRPRYAFLFALEPTNYEAWAHGLSQAGYATNPRYPAMLIRLIREHELHQYDKKALDPDYHIADKWFIDDREDSGRSTAISDNAPDSDFAPATATGRRQIREYNRIDYVVAREGDTPQSLAREMNVRQWQIIRYNDLGDNAQLTPGQKVFLQPKRRRGGADHHIARADDTMRGISQEYGIRIENLYRRNDMTYGMEPEPGQKILLRGYKGSFIEYLMRRP